MNQSPEPTPEQAMQILKILGEWVRRGWYYEAYEDSRFFNQSGVSFTDPETDSGPRPNALTSVRGVNHFDALCQATAAMQVILELYPEEK